MWRTQTVALLALVTIVKAQIPSLGWCPDYQPMANFDMNRFLGAWHEAERYFTVTEVGSRCVTTTYEKMPDGRVWVSNEIKNSFTGVKRVVDGQLQVVGRDGEGKLSVKYTSLPVPYEAQYLILDTDYKSYAVMWSCNGIGPIHAQSAWVLTRDRLAPGLVLQKAYGVLDKFKISRAFFVRTNQEDCSIQPNPIEAVDPTTETGEKENAAGKDAGQVVRQDQEPVHNVNKDKRENKPVEVPQKSALSVPELIKVSSEHKEAPKSDETQKPAADHVPGHVGPHEEKEKPAKEDKKPNEEKKPSEEAPAKEDDSRINIKSAPAEHHHQHQHHDHVEKHEVKKINKDEEKQNKKAPLKPEVERNSNVKDVSAEHHHKHHDHAEKHEDHSAVVHHSAKKGVDAVHHHEQRDKLHIDEEKPIVKKVEDDKNHGNVKDFPAEHHHEDHKEVKKAAEEKPHDVEHHHREGQHKEHLKKADPVKHHVSEHHKESLVDKAEKVEH